MVGYQFFSVGMGSECYTIVLYDTVENGMKNLSQYFTRVKYLRMEKDCRRDWHGNRKLGTGVIKACYFSGLLSPKRTRPLVEPRDMEIA